MSIENNLERIATALEKIADREVSLTALTTAVGNISETTVAATDKPKATAVKDKPAKDKPAATPPVAEPDPPAPEAEKLVAEETAPPERDPLDDDAPAVEITADQVRAALKAYRDIEGSAAMMEVLKTFGAESMSGLKPERFAEVMAAIK